MDGETLSAIIKAFSSNNEPAAACIQLVNEQWPLVRILLGDATLTHIVRSVLEVRL